MHARIPRLFRSKDYKCFLGFLNNFNKKILTSHVLDITVIISSLIASLRVTFEDIFKISSSSQVMHWSAELQTRVYDPKREGPAKDRPSE